MNYGKLLDEPFSVYRATDCVGSHRLEDLTPFPIRYKLRYITKELPEREDTPAFKFGRFFHTFALEGPDVVAQRYTMVPADAPKRPDKRQLAAKRPSDETLEAIGWWQNFALDAGTREQIEESDWLKAMAMVSSIRSKPVCADLFKAGNPEVTFRHKLASYGIQSRIDWFDGTAAAAPLVVDVKTIESLEAFDYQYEKYNYYRQAAFYRLVVSKVLGIPAAFIQFAFAVVETKPPYLCARRDPDLESLDVGATEVLRDLKLLKECYDNDDWPGSSDSGTPVSLPEWKTRKAL
jgi:hypothetical protein